MTQPEDPTTGPASATHGSVPVPPPTGAAPVETAPVDAAPVDTVRSGDSAAQSPGGASRSLRDPALLRLAALGLVVALLAALVVVLGLKDRHARQLDALRQQDSPALLAASDAARLLFSYDYRKLDQDFSAALAQTTGGFTDEYRTFTEKVVKPVAGQNQVVVAATVDKYGATGASTRDAVVALVFVDQVTTSKVITNEAVDRSRVRMTMVPKDGKWLVSKVEAL